MKSEKRPIRQHLRITVQLTTLLLFPVTFYYFSPAVPLMGAADGIVTGSLVVFAALFLSSLVLGRGFCSWVCPAGACQDLAMRANDRQVRRTRISWIKYAVWAPWISLLAFLFIRNGGARRIDFLYLTRNGVSVAEPSGYIIYYLVLAAFIIPSLIVGRRAACHTVCWMAPFMIAGRKLSNLLSLPSYRLDVTKERCTSCGTCTERCPMSIDVRAGVAAGDVGNSDCILCGECVDGCPTGTLRFRFSGPAATGRANPPGDAG